MEMHIESVLQSNKEHGAGHLSLVDYKEKA